MREHPALTHFRNLMRAAIGREGFNPYDNHAIAMACVYVVTSAPRIMRRQAD